ncbi:MAG: hypothetical protein SPL22_04890 [Treponema sp.]|uniref:InlB B-repeat-containing protein n=1 Tax=Treponema sp. TaxID=166 RepID=UPI002A916DAA|nr:hypothetical protein [Treponema sp.]MDY6397047.1 hypothetical protein [Treponema sp.]
MTVNIDSADVRIIPECSERIVVTEANPGYSDAGVSRDRAITVTFSKKPSKSSFIFSESEIPADATNKKAVFDDEKNEVPGEFWAYTLGGQTYLKNISITNSDGISLAEHFLQPELDGNILTVPVDRSNSIEIESGSSLTIVVTISDGVCDDNGVTMNGEKQWRYRATEATDEKATLTLSCENDEGSVYLAGTRDYNISQKITLSFTENADYQFLRWNYDSKIVNIAEPDKINTTAIVVEKTDASEIKAVCAKRLRVSSFSPKIDDKTPSVSKNSSIIITFDHDLPTDAEGYAQLSNISIAVGGSPVKSSFLEPVINGSSVTFAADKTNMLEVPGDQTKTVTVSVPADFFYKTGDGAKVTFGGNGEVFNYKIDSTTLEKAEITFGAAKDSGAITPATGTYYYSIGSEIPLTFALSAGWQFNGWSVSGADQNVADKIKIADEKALSTKLSVYEALQGVRVTAKTSECLRVTETSPSAKTNPKDSSIIITFNKPLAGDCSSLLNKIRVSSDGNSLDSYYTDRSISEISGDNGDFKQITIKNTSYLSVPKNSTKIITVTVPSDFYYNDGETKINLAEDSFSFTIDHTTEAKTGITYKVVNGEDGSSLSAGTIKKQSDKDKTALSYEEYNIGEEVELSLDLNSGYKFYGWEITKAGSPVTDQISYVSSNSSYLAPTLSINKPAEGITVSAICYKRPEITSFTPNSNNVNPKDSTITIEFDKDLAPTCSASLDLIKVTMNGNDVSDFFETRTLTGNTITIKNTKLLDVTGLNTKKTITVTVPAVFYYKHDENSIYMEEEYSGRYEVDSTSGKKVSVTYEADGGNLNVTDTSYNLGDVIDLKFTPTSGYQFTGWTVKDSAGDEIDESKIKIADSSSTSTKMYIYEQVDNVTVKAESYLVPIVQSVKLNGTVDIFSVNSFNSYSNIHLKFNKEIDGASESVSPSGSITITKTGKNGIHYEEYFCERWKSSTDSTELILTPTSSFRNLVKNENNQLAMTITLNANGKSITDRDGHPLCPSEEIYNSLAINCLVSGSQETNPPVISDIHLYSTNDTSAHFYRELSNQPESSWQKILRYSNGWGTYSTNHVSSVYITLSGYDLESGIKEVQVTETYKKDNEGGYVAQETSSTRSFRIVDSYDNDSNGNTVYNYAFTYDFDSEHTTADGLFKLTISLWDNEGNKTEKDYYVIKDTQNNVRLDKILIYTKNDFQTRVPVYNSEKNCYETDFTFSEFRIYSDKFYKHYGTTYLNTSRYLTVTLYEDGVNKGEVFSSNIGTDYDLKDRINTALSNIKRDIDKDYILRAKVEQENGIIEELELPFYKSTYIAGLMGHSIYLYDRIIVTDLRENDDVSVCFSTVPNPSKDDLIDYMRGSSGRDPDLDGEGTYYLFPRVTTQLGQKSRFDFGFRDYRPICVSKPFAYYNGVTAPTDDSIQFPTMTLPNPSYEAGEVTYEPNTGYATFDIDIEYPDDDYDYSQYRYIIRFDEIRDRNDASECFYDGRNIRVKTGTVKTVYLVALDSLGNECAKSDEQTLDLTLVDNQPPFITGGINYHASFNDYRNYRLFLSRWQGYVLLNGRYYDDTRIEPFDVNGSLENVPNHNPITCYVVPKSYGINLTKEQLDSGEFNKTTIQLSDTYYNDAKYLTIPYAGIDFGDYYIYSYLEDNSPLKNNYLKVAPYLMRYYIANYVPEVSFESVESVDQIKVSAQPYGRIHRRTNSYPYANELRNDEQHIHGNFVNIQSLEDNSWTPCVEFDNQPNYSRSTIARMKDVNGTDSFYVGNIDADTRYYYSVDCSDYENKFMQVIVNYTSTDWRDGAGYGRWDFEIVQSQPLYVYPDYLRYKGTDNEIVCNNKNWIVGANGYQIFTDNPVFVHTMYCSRDFSSELYAERFGTATTEQYIREWEARAQETGIVTYTGTTNTSFTYGSDNYKDIPDGYYYTTIAHFADGTTLMGEVKQK